MTRRLTKLAALYLLLGLAATWIVAWGSAMFFTVLPTQQWAYEQDGPPHRVISLGSGVAVRSFELEQCLSDKTLDRVFAFENLTNIERVQDYRMPQIADEIMRIGDVAPDRFVVEVVARGWPWPAASSQVTLADDWIDFMLFQDGPDYWLASRLWQQPANGSGIGPPTQPYRSRGAVEVSARWLGGTNTKLGAAALPCIPYWPGLLADTLFYALLLAALQKLTAYARRARRRRRNRCTACGYDLQGLNAPACPECGRALSPAHRATATPDRA